MRYTGAGCRWGSLCFLAISINCWPGYGSGLAAWRQLGNVVVEGQTVFVVDDDLAVRDALAALLTAEGFAVAGFSSAVEFLDSLGQKPKGCIVLDINLPEISGLDLQQLLTQRGIDLPIIFLTGFGDVPKVTAGFKGGAVDFLEKPVDSEVLTQSVRRALEIGARRSDDQVRQEELGALFSHLTPREKEIIVLLARGYSAKQIGRALGISHRTAEIHRARIMEKLEVQSLAELVALSVRLGIR